jgi:hypothetical protein
MQFFSLECCVSLQQHKALEDGNKESVNKKCSQEYNENALQPALFIGTRKPFLICPFLLYISTFAQRKMNCVRKKFSSGSFQGLKVEVFSLLLLMLSMSDRLVLTRR